MVMKWALFMDSLSPRGRFWTFLLHAYILQWFLTLPFIGAGKGFPDIDWLGPFGSSFVWPVYVILYMCFEFFWQSFIALGIAVVSGYFWIKRNNYFCFVSGVVALVFFNPFVMYALAYLFRNFRML